MLLTTVTEKEVHAGILSVDDPKGKVLCFERTLIDIGTKDSMAGRFSTLFVRCQNVLKKCFVTVFMTYIIQL